jgi:hypothetical protein
VQRGTVRTLTDLPHPLDRSCRALKADLGIEAIQAIAFPVKNQR